MITLPYVLTCTAIVVTPGPAFSVIVDQCLRHGRPAGLAAVAGNTTGLAVWALASALGLTALIRASELAFVALKVAGALYLCFLGIKAIVRSRRHAEGAPGHPRRQRGSGYRAGLLSNLTNPKAAVLYLALLPQFLPARVNPLPATAILTVTQMAISVTWYSLIVLFVGFARHVLTQPRFKTRIEQLSGVIMLGLGVRLAALGRSAL